MPFFRYKAQSRDGEETDGMIQAASENVAADILTDKGFSIISISEEKRGLFEQSLGFLNRVKIQDLVIFSRQLSIIQLS